MEASDKVYIDDLAVVNDCITKISTTPLPNFSEYIRKDALLEWAESYKNAIIEESKIYNGFAARASKVVLEDLINKLNSMV